MNRVQTVFERIFYKHPKTIKEIIFSFSLIIFLISSFFTFAFYNIDNNEIFIISLIIIDILIFFSFILLGKNALIVFLLYILFNIFAALANINSIFKNTPWILNLIFLNVYVVHFLRQIDNIDTEEKLFEIKNLELEKQQHEAIDKINKLKKIIDGAKDTVNKYKILNKIAQKLTSAIDFKTINQILHSAIFEITGNKPIKYTLAFYDDEIKRYRLIMEEENIKNTENIEMMPTSIKIYDNLDAFDNWVIKQKYSLYVKDIEKDFRFKDLKKSKLPFKFILVIPLLGNKKSADKKNENEIIGLLRFYSDIPEIIDNEEARLFNYLANLCANAIQNTLLFQETQKLAIKDGLTGLYLRRYFIERLDEEIKRAKESQKDLSFLLIDIDHFKQCNDTYGHIFGDKVLKVLGEFLKTDLREVDIIGRYGGEEFAAILLNTNLNGARATAERLRREFSKLVISVNENEAVKLTLSIGGVYYRPEYKLLELINLADKALYYSKQNGRNRVTFWEDIS
ncbi:MAG: sensor domain-containing diguanylate cyclase [Candidatus Goldbacteria bacterium]|nr:sensor domain-containing diguanylate cyclase [Candidatus Goldiibacteriota bacterium]